MTYYDKIRELVEYHQYSNYIAIRCPFPDHPDEKPSCFVYEDADREENNRKFHCSGCGKSGTHQYLLKVITGSNVALAPSVRKEHKFLPKWKKWQEQFGNLENLVQFANENVRRYNFDWYFRKRGLLDVVDVLKLGYKDEWILFPIYDPSGKLIDIVTRDVKGRSKYVIHPDTDRESPYLYVPDWKFVMSSRLVYVVYGMIDAISLYMAGLPVVTGTTGKSLSYNSLMNLNKKWVIIPDRHEETEARSLAKSLGNFTRVARLPYLEDEKDPDEVRMKRGLDTLKSLIQGA